jgi:sulfur relay (sulfurtransferase) complex TusBCD TusD component (DsrE family)
MLSGVKMAKLLIILFSPPIQSQNTDTVFELAKATVELGHQVTVFCDADGTYNLMASQELPNQTTPANKMAQLIKKGVHVLACRESARLRGILAEGGFLEGVVESSLGRLAELMEEHDRIIAFG